MFDISSESQTSLSELNSLIWENHQISDRLDHHKQTKLNVMPDYGNWDLETIETTEFSLISSVQSAIDLVNQQLTEVALSSQYDQITGLAFGENYNQHIADLIQNSFALGDFAELPKIQVISAELLGQANGAYAKQLDTIFLSDQFIQSHNTQEIAGVLTEEIGHYIDSRINTVDVAGDEGDIFSRLVQGKALSSAELAELKQEDDRAVIVLNDQEVEIEKNDNLSTAYNLGTLTGSRGFSDWVGSSDVNDYYRFSISTQSNVSLTLNGLTGDADLQLIQDFNNNRMVDSSDVLQGSYNCSTTADTISRTLNTGTYFARVYPMIEVNTNYNLAFNSTTISSDWYSQNLRDAGLVSCTRSLGTDGKLSRNDMISIFRNAQDGSVIDTNELTDLRTIVSYSNRFAMDNFVKVLSSKIVNGNPANNRSGFGNLYGGSSATQMENLIGKWFLGTDRPDAYSMDGRTQYTYRRMSGSLFQNGISYQDIQQGDLGDCYLLAGLAGAASRSSQAIENMFINNGDGSYTVRFYNNGVADYVTVDSYLPTDSSGRLVYASRGAAYNNSANELWVALAEKAYAQMNESGWISRWNNDHNNAYQTRDPNYVTNGYQNNTGINGGMSIDVLKQITNQNSTSDWSLTDSDRTNIINQFNAGRTVFINWEAHALTLVGYNPTTQLFRIHNPWGMVYNLNWSQMLSGNYDYNAWASGTQSGQRFTDWSYSV